MTESRTEIAFMVVLAGLILAMVGAVSYRVGHRNGASECCVDAGELGQ